MMLAFKQQILVVLLSCVSYCIFSINYVYSNSAAIQQHHEDHHALHHVKIDQHSPPHTAHDGTKKNNTKFVSYQVIRGHQPNQTHLEDYRDCDGIGRGVLDESLKKPGILDFHTQVDTNLDILYVGSSVAMQFSQSFQDATQSIKRQVIRYAMRNIRFEWKGMHENTHVSLTKGGGTVAGLRTTGLLLNNNRDKARFVAPRAGGGWFTSDVRELKRMVHKWMKVETLIGYNSSSSPCEQIHNVKKDPAINATSDTLYSCEEKNFDVVVHQLPVRIVALSILADMFEILVQQIYSAAFFFYPFVG